MTEDDRRTEELARAGLAAGQAVMGDMAATLAMIFPGDAGSWAHTFTQAVGFLRLAGGATGEPVYRWLAMRGLHALPVDGYAKVEPEVRLFFETFAATVTVLRPLLFPNEGGAPVVIPPSGHPAERAERIGDPTGRLDERVGGGRGPRTTAEVPVYVPPERRAETVAAMMENEGRAIKGRQQPTPGEDYFPTPEELAGMSIDERRRWITADPRFRDPAIVTMAPPLEGFRKETVRTPFGTGEILVPPGKRIAPQVASPEAGSDGAQAPSELPLSSPGVADPEPGEGDAGGGAVDKPSPALEASPPAEMPPQLAVEDGAGEVGESPSPASVVSKKRGRA